MHDSPAGRPLPLVAFYPVVFVAIYLSHHSLLSLPWFWDEAGYYIPAALDFFRTGSLIPHSTLTNAHPPLPSILLGVWWHLTGLSIEGTRSFLCMVAAAALLGVFALARRLTGDSVALVVTLLTGLYPVWFVQSTLAHADLFAAAFTLWALAVYFNPVATRLRLSAIATLFSLAVLAKETAIVTPVALAAYLAVQRVLARDHRAPSRASTASSGCVSSASSAQHGWCEILALASPVLPLMLWYAYHRHITGFTFGNPEFLRYNATANLSPLRIMLSLWHRLTHLFFHMNMWVPIACTIALLPGKPRTPQPGSGLTRQSRITLAVILAANALAFSVLGGALLTRYLLPLYPLVLLVCVSFWHQRLRHWRWIAALSAVAFCAALFLNPPYSFAPEDNLTYASFIELHQRAIHLIEHDFPDATVLTSWPATAELTYPDLGYIRRPVFTFAIENFSLDELEKAARNPGEFDTALLFSTKWVPPPGARFLTRRTERADTRFFDFHRDLSPAEAAQVLGGHILWQAESRGEWAAILRFPRSNQAAAGLKLLSPAAGRAHGFCNDLQSNGADFVDSPPHLRCHAAASASFERARPD